MSQTPRPEFNRPIDTPIGIGSNSQTARHLAESAFIKDFVAAQKEMKSALKDSVNPFFKSKYSDLASVDAACKSALNSHNIAISQAIDFEGETDFLKTELLHISGDKITSRCRLINPKKDNQGFGGSVTYMRRYSLASLCAVVTEDDDGNTADNKTRPNGKTPFEATVEDSYMDEMPNPFETPITYTKNISEKQAKMVYAKMKALGMTLEMIKTFLADNVGCFVTDHIPSDKLDFVLKKLDERITKNEPRIR